MAFSGRLRWSRGRGGQGAGEERPGPIILKDLNSQRGDERQQPVGHVGQNQLLVGITADTNVGGASLRQGAEREGTQSHERKVQLRLFSK